MSGLWVAVVVLVLIAAVLAIAETSISRMTRVRAIALKAEGQRNAELLERIETDPPRYLNAVYLCVMCAQNGSAVLVALIAGELFEPWGVTVVAVAFTLVYFVVVEAMAKTFGILHSNRAALALAPLVWVLGRILALPTRALIGLANILLPGKGLKHGPFVSEEDIRTMAEVGHEEGSIEEQEKELIHSVFEFGDTLVREVMVPRPDVLGVSVEASLDEVRDLMLEHGHSRLPVFRIDLEHTEGFVHAKDLLRALQQGTGKLRDVMRPPHFVPDSKRVAELLREMQREQFHMALVIDEYGSVSGMITLEDVLEELVGEIADEHDWHDPEVVRLDEGRYRVHGTLSIDELNGLLDVELPQEDWDSVGGLMLHVVGTIPREGQEVRVNGVLLKAEKVQRRRVLSVLVTRVPVESTDTPAS